MTLVALIRTAAVLCLTVSAAWADGQATAEFVTLGRLGVAVRRPHSGPAPHVAVIYENGESSPFNAMCAQLAERGFLTLCAIQHEAANSEWETVALDGKALVEYALSQAGITKVVLYGHSGGGAVASFYQAVAENGPGFCRDAKKLTACTSDFPNLPTADAVVFPDAHPGLGVMSLRMINPSLSTDGMKLHVDPALDPFNPVNGFNANGASRYSPVFQLTYSKAQASIMNGLIAKAQRIRAEMAAGLLTDAVADQIVIQQFSFANHLDELDPAALGLMSTRNPQRLLRNDGSIVTQMIKSTSVGNPSEAPHLGHPSASFETTAQFLSRGAVKARDSVDAIDYCTSNSNTVCNVESIHVPVLFIASGANTFIADEERMYERSPAKDKEYIVVEGALHGGQPCAQCEKTPDEFRNSEQNLYNYVRDWINKRV